MERISSHFHLENDSTPRGDDLWGWSVWVAGPDEQLDEIESVTYRLHPTFRNPNQRVTDRASNFKLKASGWGEFSIRATVATKDGETVRLERWLQLGEDVVGRGVDETPRPIKVYISHGLVDVPLVHELSEELSRQGIDVMGPDRDILPGQVLEDALDMQLRAADAVLVVISNPPNSFVIAEGAHALKLDRLVLPIVVDAADAPAPFNTIQRLKLDQEQNIAELANTIVSRVKDYAIED